MHIIVWLTHLAHSYIPYIGNHLQKKNFANHLLWHSLRENIRDSQENDLEVALSCVARAIFAQAPERDNALREIAL